MRIVAGELGGRKLRVPKGEAVRPTTDRVREALFSILGDVGGLDVLDLYCGTGALGLEALSRGAAAVTFVDTDIRPARTNAKELGVIDRVDLIRADTSAFLRRDRRSHDLVLLDPPYRLARSVAPDLSELLAPRLHAGARVVVESAAGEPLELDGSAYTLSDERSYGTTAIRIYEIGRSAGVSR